MEEAKTDEQIVESLLAPEPAPENQTEVGEADEAKEQVEDAEVVDEAEEEESAEDTEEETDELEDDDSDESEDEDDETDDEDDEEPEDVYTVKVNGQEEQVTLEELKRGYSGQTHIQREMQKLADQRKSFEETQAQVQQFAQTLQQERETILQLAQQVQQGGFKPQPQEPDPQMLKDDPIGYMEAEAQYKRELKEWQDQQQTLQQQQQQAQQYYQQQRQQLLEQNKQKLLQEIPEFGDAEKAPKLREELVSLAQEYGYSKEEIEANVDARRVKELYDLAQYKKLLKGREQAKKPKRNPKAIKKSTGNKRAGKEMQRRKKLEQARQSQTDEAWASLLLE